MKQIIDGKTYNTETADQICGYGNGLGCSDFRHIDAEIYKTKKGNYFIAGEGGPMSIFSEPAGNMTSGGTGIVPLSHDEALEYAESHNSNADTDDIEKYFNVEEA